MSSDAQRSHADAETTKERFAFASGNILACGALVFHLWPAVARYQTGMHLHFWSTNLPHEGVRPQFWIFMAMTGVLATGICATVFAGVHIACHGLWLGAQSSQGTRSASGLLSKLRLVGDVTYSASFSLAAVLLLWLCLTPLVLLSGGIEQFLVHLSVAPKIAGYVTRFGVIALFIAWMAHLRLMPRIKAAVERSHIMLLALHSALLAVVVFLLAWSLVTELCNTLDLQLDRQVLSKTHGDPVRVELTLRGATSDPSFASLRLRARDTQQARSVTFSALDGGRYVAVLPAADLAPGAYDLLLDYPHLGWSDAFPHLRRVEVSRGLIVLP